MSRARYPPRRSRGPLQAHTVAVNEAAISFLEAARSRGDEFGPLSWHHEVAHPRAGVVSLNVVLAKLRELHDLPWFDYLEALLCDPLATNLRNDIAHGIRQRVGGVEAALLIQAACHLTLIRVAEGDDEGNRAG